MITDSIGYVAAFLFLWQGEYFRKKSSQIQNGLEAQVTSLSGVLCLNALIAGLCKVAKIPVGLPVIAVCDACVGLLCWRFILKKGETQKYVWRFTDVAGVLGITAFCAVLCVSVFTSSLLYRYTNSDAGLHLREATMVLRTNQVEGMFFSHFQFAMVIEILQPFLREVTWYKGFIAADIAFQWLEILIFFVWIKKLAAGKFLTALACLTVPFYYLAYPIHSFYFSFTYWGLGVLLLIYILLLLQRERERMERRSIVLAQLMPACFSLCVCYMLFAPVAFVCVWLELLWGGEKKRRFSVKCKETLFVFLLPCALGIYFCYFDFFFRQGTSILGSIQNEGGIYSNLFGNFILLMPMAGYGWIRGIRKKQPQAVCFTGFLAFAACMLLGVLYGRISEYYFYKNYYPLWAFSWYFFFYGISILYKKNRELAAANLGGCLLCGVLVFSGIDGRFVSSMDERNGVDRHYSEAFDLYAWNRIYRPQDR